MANHTPIGIDLGTTNSCSALFKHNAIQGHDLMVVPTEVSAKTLPSYIYYNKDTTEVVVGSAAKNNHKNHYDSTVYDSKRMIGKRYSELSPDDLRNWPFRVVNKNGKVFMRVKHNKVDVDLNPEDVSSEILKKLKLNADRFCANDETKKTSAVITVPAYFKNSQRQKTIEAAKKANLKVLRIINEPTAAAAAYCYENRAITDLCNTRLLIYDFGGGTFDISVIDIETTNLPVRNDSGKPDVEMTITVKATGGDNHLGGQDIDNSIVKHFANLYEKQSGVSLYQDKENCIKKRILLKKSSEEAKIVLSSATEATVDCDFLEDAGVNTTLTRASMENICTDLLEKTISITEEILDNTGISKATIKGVVLVGGSSKIPKVVELIKSCFPKAKIYNNINGDEVVAQGAAIVASNILFKNIIVKDIITHTLSTDQNDDDAVVMIPRFKNVPYSCTRTFRTYEDNQKTMDINIYEGEEDKESRNTLLKEFSINNIPPKRCGDVRVNVTFDIDINGVLKVSAKAEGLGIEDTLTVE